jgi:flagellar assembly factor FliW
MNSITIQSDQFGEFQTSEEFVYSFPKGIPGIPEFTEAVLISAVGTEEFDDLEVASSFWWLQDTQDPTLAFLCVDPWLVAPEYEVDFDADELGVASPEEVMVISIVSSQENGMTVNLRAPLVLNTKARHGEQIVLDDPQWLVRQPMGV